MCILVSFLRHRLIIVYIACQLLNASTRFRNIGGEENSWLFGEARLLRYSSDPNLANTLVDMYDKWEILGIGRKIAENVFEVWIICEC